MTLQWTFVAGVLYLEIFVICLLLLPFISPPRWQRIFRSGFCQKLSAYSNIYFNVFIAILVLLFLDSIRETMKYTGAGAGSAEGTHYPEAENRIHMKLFRAQRNMNMTGFCLLVWVILRRLVTLIAREANLMAESEASIKQAKSATDAAKLLMEERGVTDDNKKNKSAEAKGDGSEVDGKAKARDHSKTEVELEKTKEELYRTKVEFESMKKQAESTNREYDRIVEEFNKLERKLATFEGADSGDKKGN